MLANDWKSLTRLIFKWFRSCEVANFAISWPILHQNISERLIYYIEVDFWKYFDESSSNLDNNDTLI